MSKKREDLANALWKMDYIIIALYIVPFLTFLGELKQQQ